MPCKSLCSVLIEVLKFEMLDRFCAFLSISRNKYCLMTKADKSGSVGSAVLVQNGVTCCSIITSRLDTLGLDLACFVSDGDREVDYPPSLP